MNTFFYARLLPVIGSLSLGVPAFADHPSLAFGSDSAGPINTVSASVLPEGKWSGGLRTELTSFDGFSSNELARFAENGLEGVHSVEHLTKTTLSLAWGVSERLTASLQVPYIERRSINEAEIEDDVAEAHRHGGSSGLGDLVLLGHYQVVAGDETDVALLFGVKVPSGENDVKDSGGHRFETEFQPGSGSLDYLAGMAVSRRLTAVNLHANVLYHATNGGAQGAEIGNALSYNAALTYRLAAPHRHHAQHHHDHHGMLHGNGMRWDLVLELNGETRGKDKVAGTADTHSGGTKVYFASGIRLSLTDNWSGYLSYAIPVVENHKGEQTDVDQRIVAGVSVSF